ASSPAISTCTIRSRGPQHAMTISSETRRQSRIPRHSPSVLLIYHRLKRATKIRTCLRCEEGAPRRDHERVRHHRGANAAGRMAGAAAEPAEGACDDQPLPIGEVPEPEVDDAEKN